MAARFFGAGSSATPAAGATVDVATLSQMLDQNFAIANQNTELQFQQVLGLCKTIQGVQSEQASHLDAHDRLVQER